MTSYSFLSKKIFYEIEDAIQTVAFSETDSADPDVYLILQRGIPDEDQYYFEFNSRSWSGEGGFSKAHLTKHSLCIEFGENLKNKYKTDEVEIKFGALSQNEFEELKASLENIFVNSDCNFFIS